MKKTLPSVRLELATFEHICQAIHKYNEKNLVLMTEADFRRLAYELLAQMILQDKPLPIKLV